MGERIKIMLVDDHRIVRNGIRLILEKTGGMDIVAEASEPPEALAKALELHPQVIVMDVHLTTGDGIETCRQILESQPDIKVVMLSSDASGSVVTRALDSGASGFVFKEAAADELVRAIEAVRADRIYLCPEVTTTLIRSRNAETLSKTANVLSDRERELLRLVSSGMRNKEIAAQLGLNIKSIEAQRARLMTKLGCESLPDLVRYAVREGIIPL